MRKFRVDPKTAKVLYKVQPEGLPALWIEDGLCDRCKEYGKCLEVKDLSEEDWFEFKFKIEQGVAIEQSYTFASFGNLTLKRITNSLFI
ncbi:MAG: hypothetical protein Q8T03_07050 [Bacteroidota bacterium]|nr:hypothetical protein [Bacteroidota bacterium]